MEVGIVGLLGAGKTSLFRALTGAAGSSARGSGGQAPNVGVVRVPDPRLETIARFVTTKEIVPATFQAVDIPGFATGGEAAAYARQVLGHIREVDAICHVVRCFANAGAPPTPDKDIDALETEMIFADLAVAEPALDKAQRAAKSGDRETKQRLAVLERMLPVLSAGEPLRPIMPDLSEDDRALVRGYGMLSAKPILYIANVAEDDLAGTSDAAAAVERDGAATAGSSARADTGARAVHICAKLEAELIELEEPDRQEMLDSLGLEHPAVDVIAAALFDLLGLAEFYTAGPKQVRAWPVPAGATALEAATVVHTDMARGFIRAECYHVDDLAELGSEKAIKDAGRLRSEGKNYRLRDGDVVHFLFNV